MACLFTDGFQTTWRRTTLEAPTKFIPSEHHFVEANNTFALLIGLLKIPIVVCLWNWSWLPCIWIISFPSSQPIFAFIWSVINFNRKIYWLKICTFSFIAVLNCMSDIIKFFFTPTSEWSLYSLSLSWLILEFSYSDDQQSAAKDGCIDKRDTLYPISKLFSKHSSVGIRVFCSDFGSKRITQSVNPSKLFRRMLFLWTWKKGCMIPLIFSIALSTSLVLESYWTELARGLFEYLRLDETMSANAFSFSIFSSLTKCRVLKSPSKLFWKGIPERVTSFLYELLGGFSKWS